jgi:hypothetical protein
MSVTITANVQADHLVLTVTYSECMEQFTATWTREDQLPKHTQGWDTSRNWEETDCLAITFAF